MDNKVVLDYLRATTNLYGIVPPEKVVEIFNQQNEETISMDDLQQFTETQRESFQYFEGYFVHEAIFVDDSFDHLRAKQGDKPYYIPARSKLLKFADGSYVEKPKEYKQLYAYIHENIVHDPEKADELTEDILLDCALDFSIDSVMNEFNRRKISFESQAQLMELMPLIMELSNNTRIWDNRGYTPNELFTRFDDAPRRRSIPGGARKKVGRNEPCPCGSGKKYKKCCSLRRGTNS